MYRNALIVLTSIAAVLAAGTVLGQIFPVYGIAAAERSKPERATLQSRVSVLESRVEALGDREQIRDVYLRYARGLNRYDMDLLEGAFWADAQINYGYQSSQRDEWIAGWRESHKVGVTSQAHCLSNQKIDVDGNTAHVETYLIALHRTKDEKPAMIKAGRYVDRLERRNGEWKIAVRVFIPHFWAEVRSVFDSAFVAEGWPQDIDGLGALDERDPSYRRPLSRRPDSAAR